MKRASHVWWPALVVFTLSIPVSAQPVATGNVWSHGTTLNVFAGAGIDSSKTSPLAGASVGWEITPRIGIEGSGYWLDPGTRTDAFAAALKLQAGLTAPHGAVPFLEAGVGLYRASFAPTASPVPDFYRRRMAARMMGLGATHTFTDPSFVLGGGVNIFVARHIAIRPNVETMIIRREAHTYSVTAVAVHLSYHFEDHPVTPARDRR